LLRLKILHRPCIIAILPFFSRQADKEEHHLFPGESRKKATDYLSRAQKRGAWSTKPSYRYLCRLKPGEKTTQRLQ